MATVGVKGLYCACIELGGFGGLMVCSCSTLLGNKMAAVTMVL